jgi:hypothetical protein
VQRLLRDLELLRHHGDVAALTEQAVRLPQPPSASSRPAPASARRLRPITSIVFLAMEWAVRLSQRPDRTQRVTSSESEQILTTVWGSRSCTPITVRALRPGALARPFRFVGEKDSSDPLSRFAPGRGSGPGGRSGVHQAVPPFSPRGSGAEVWPSVVNCPSLS